jgi:hypothetical protein
VSGWPGAVDAPSRVCVRRPGCWGGCVRKLLHAPPAFACEGAWVVAGGRCCMHPRVCVRGGLGDRGRVLLHRPPAFACKGAWVIVGGCCCTDPLCLRARGYWDHGWVVACTPMHLRARGSVGVGVAGRCCALHAFASAISSPKGEAVKAPQLLPTGCGNGFGFGVHDAY